MRTWNVLGSLPVRADHRAHLRLPVRLGHDNRTLQMLVRNKSNDNLAVTISGNPTRFNDDVLMDTTLQ